MRFERYIGIDYSGAQTPTSRLRGLQVYEARQGSGPVKITLPADRARSWSRQEIAQYCRAAFVTVCSGITSTHR